MYSLTFKLALADLLFYSTHPSEIQRLLEKKMYMVFLAKYQLFNISIAKIYWFKNISTGEKVQKHFFSSINICLRWNFAKKPPCKISPINAEFLRGAPPPKNQGLLILTFECICIFRTLLFYVTINKDDLREQWGAGIEVDLTRLSTTNQYRQAEGRADTFLFRLDNTC